MKKLLYRFLLFSIVATSISCEIDEINDPNNPPLESVIKNASNNELQVLVTGLEARHRGYYQNATEMFGSFGREVLPYFGSDPRFPEHWLGIGVSDTYSDFFTSGGTYINPYLAVKQANVLIEATQNSNPNLVSEQQRAGYIGYAKTIKGYQLLWPLLQQYQNGIRIDVEDPYNPGPILSYSDALARIRTILDEGAQSLANAGNSLEFNLTKGWDGFRSPSGLLQVNRAIAARAALYAEDFDGALQALSNSFMELNVSTSTGLYIGPQHVYGEAPDVNNPLFYIPNAETNTLLVVHPSMIEDALPGDRRINKFFKRKEAITNSRIKDKDGNNIPGEYQDARWETNTDPIPFIRNEELILIYAEAQVRKAAPNFDEAVNAINTIRNIWGVRNYDGPLTQEALMEEILFQRRYSLWAEAGHRWIDLRRTGRLNENYIDLRDQGSIFTQVARRSSEVNWENQN